jgi:AcrR family transcriptional regulator
MSSGDPETRVRILKETRRLMEERRGKDVRLEDIARAAGVSRQAVYLHFGSRSGLLIATARYLDEVLELRDRVKPYREAPNGIAALDAFVEFWGNYMPDIYGLAKALLTVRETDEAAADAWADRMAAVYQGCKIVVNRLFEENHLAPEWNREEAADFFFSLLSLLNWEYLTMERGWSNHQFIQRMQTVLKKTLVKPS